MSLHKSVANLQSLKGYIRTGKAHTKKKRCVRNQGRLLTSPKGSRKSTQMIVKDEKISQENIKEINSDFISNKYTSYQYWQN